MFEHDVFISYPHLSNKDNNAGQNGWIDEPRIMMEVLFAIRRAGADMILSYFAKDAARLLHGQ